MAQDNVWNLPQELLNSNVVVSLAGHLVSSRGPKGEELPPSFPVVPGRLVAMRGGAIVLRDDEQGVEHYIPYHRIELVSKVSSIAVASSMPAVPGKISLS